MGRRVELGEGTALVLPDDIPPEALIWPPLDFVVVAWPRCDERALHRKLCLARALVGDGVRFAAIQHEPDWFQVWREGAHFHG